MNQLRHVRFMRHSRDWTVMSLIVYALLAACQPIQPATTRTIPTEANPPDLAEYEIERWSEIAPNGDWQANGLVALPKPGTDQYYTELRARRITGGVEWTPVATWSNFGLGYTTPRPLHWSPDGEYLYFTNAPVVDGCGLFVNASDLQRLDLNDGSVYQYFPLDTTSSLTFAPDGQTVAYSAGELLYLLDPITGNYATLTLDILGPNVQWGNFVWSPDSQQVVFTVVNDPCRANQQQSIVWVNRPSMTISVLVEPDERLFTAVEWLDPEHIQLQDRDNQFWQLDINTGEIVQ